MADRINYIINQIDESLKNFYFKDIRFFGLCRQESKKGERQPVSYKGSGEYELATFSDKNAMSIYHRITSMSENDDMNGGFGTNILKEENYSVRMVVFGSQKKVNNAGIDINYRLGDELKGLIPTSLASGHLSAIDAQTLRIVTTGVDYDKARVFSEELPDTELNVKPDHILLAVTYSIALKYLQDCKTNSCGDIPTSNSCDPVTIVDQDGSELAEVECGEEYSVLVFSGIQDDGSGSYSNSIVDNT